MKTVGHFDAAINTQGTYQITPYDPEFEKKMSKADDILHRYRNTLRVLAK